MECLQENYSKTSFLTSQTTQEESNQDEKFLGKKLKKNLDLDEIIPFENISYESQVSSFNTVVEKFTEFIEKDRERIKKNESPLMNEQSIKKLHIFIEKFVDVYKNYHPDLKKIYEQIKHMK